jgi:hypothetical protein
VTVAQGDEVDIGTLSVAPQHGSLEGSVRDAQGDPVAGTAVRITQIGELAEGSIHTVLSDAAGHFEVPQLTAGVWFAAAEVRGASLGIEVTIAAGARAELELVPPYEGDGDTDAEPYPDEEYAGDDDYPPDGYRPSFDVGWDDSGQWVVLPTGGDLPAGLLPGDRIIAVDGGSPADTSLDGDEDSVLRLRVRRPATGAEFDVTVRRDQPMYYEGC